MERNWYVICTKQLQEKKVTALLSKKGIENYCPFTSIERKEASRTMTALQPLFSSYVFACITEAEIPAIKKIPYIINTVYWKSKPVIINLEEISAIKIMVDNYSKIILKKIAISTNEKVDIVEESVTGYSNNLLSIKHKGLSITLPSLGYQMIAHRESLQQVATEKKTSIGNLLAKRLYPAFLFGF